jgi:hypothetical protein
MIKKLGYYTCNGIEFGSKIQAMIYANPRNLDIQWHFNNEIFDNFKWDIDPILTLDQLYDQRSRQLREQYDYIIISYSGGSDSNNILESFIRQGLHIDEVITNWPLDISDKFLDYSGKEKSSWNNKAEFKLNTTARLQYIRDKCPRTKITINDTSRVLLDGVLPKDDSPSWVENQNDIVNITGVSNYSLTYFKEVRETLDKNKKIAYLIGVDKPRLYIEKDKLYINFSDKTANIVPVNNHLEEYPNVYPILYYWDPDCVELLAKQAHVVLNCLNSDSRYLDIWRSMNPNIRTLHEELLKFIIYPSTWSKNYWQTTKATKDWDSELDYWFTRGMQDTREFETWKNGIKYLVPKISNFLVKFGNGVIWGSKEYTTKKYFIGDIKPKLTLI